VNEVQQRFQTLIEEHKGILYKVCNSYCRNRDDREDLAQEIAVQLWRSFGTFDEHWRFSTWMYRVALNVAISFYRRESTRVRNVVPAGGRLLDTVEAPAAPSGAVAALYRFIEQLEPLKKALVLLYLDGNSYREIAEVLGISETNVATKINRLKKEMRV
jgi:RNA polymerase sigma factor (sigma-70 family)